MSQSPRIEEDQEDIKPPPKPKSKSYRYEAILCPGGLSEPFIGETQDTSTIGVKLVCSMKATESRWMGLELEFPLGENNENDGFGQCHEWNAATSKITTTSISRMLVKFPRGHFTLHVEDLPAHLQTCFPSKTSEPEACLLRISVDDEADVKVHGFAMPFANPGHISEDWLLRFKPIVGQHTLLDILQSKSFVFIVPKFRKIVEKHWDGSLLPPEFSYPFGERHDWDADRMSRLIQLNKGLQYPPSWTFEDDNAHMTVLTQCMAQDVLWIDECRQQIRRAQCSAYFIPKDLAGQVTRYYAILALDKGLKSNNLAAWRRLAKDLHVDLELFKTFNKDSTATAATLQARILEHPKAIDIFRSQHPVKEHEIVLSVTVHHKEALDFKLATFESRAEANTALEQGTEH